MTQNNKFSKSMKALKSEEQKSSDSNNSYAQEIIKSNIDSEETENKNDIIDSIFSHSDDFFKVKSGRAHSVYLKDGTWDKLSSIAKKNNMSASSALQKILDNIL